MLFPPGSIGRVNVHENAPLESVMMLLPLGVPAEHLVDDKLIPSKVTVASELTSNPEPLTVSGLPTGP